MGNLFLRLTAVRVGEGEHAEQVHGGHGSALPRQPRRSQSILGAAGHGPSVGIFVCTTVHMRHLSETAISSLEYMSYLCTLRGFV